MIAEEIISYVKQNRVSTTEVADALGKQGALPGIFPVNPSQFRVGRVKTVFTSYESNYCLHEQIRNVREGDVVLIFSHKCKGRALFGSLVSKFLVLYQQAQAVVADGNVRDIAEIKREGHPVWARGINPIGCFNSNAPIFPKKLTQKLKRQYEGGIAICDDGGVVVIPPARITKDTLERLKKIEVQEDIWFFCLDALKWDTKKIVCDKEYLKDSSLLSSVHIEKLKELDRKT